MRAFSMGAVFAGAILLGAILGLVACGEAAVVEADLPADVLSGDHLWVVDEAASTLRFRGRQEGAAFEGEFERWSAQINLDPDDLSDAQIRASIDMGSAVTGDGDRDGALPTRDWFDAKAFPVATFTSDRVMRDAGGLVADGTLSIKGVEPAVVLPFTLDVDGERAVADGRLNLSRADYGVGSGSYATEEWIAFPVDVILHVEAYRRTP